MLKDDPVFDDRLQPTRENLVSFIFPPRLRGDGVFFVPLLMRLVACSCVNFETWLRMRLLGINSRFFVSLASFLMSFG